MRIDVYLHSDDPQLDRIEAFVTTLNERMGTLMATIEEVVQAVADVKAAVAPLPDAINALEAAITAAGLSAAQKAALDQALADLKDVGTTVTAALADAADGVDEAAGGGGGPV